MNRFHGILSLLLIVISAATGFIGISATSSILAVSYAVITLLASCCIIYFYCLKCTCREDACGHVLPGKMAAFFPDRKPGKYSLLDMTATALAVTLIIGFPQYWLWKYKPLFAVFWIMIIIAFADILLCVCRNCENKNCPICQKSKRIESC